MKVKHNKKRNTAVIYETLLKDMTAAILKGDNSRKQAIISILKEHFSIGTTLNKDLSCYRSIYETRDLSAETSQRIILEAKRQRASLDPKELFEAQTRTIHDINKKVDPSIFSNFVPNYKTLATIHQIFSDNLSPKERVLLENKIVEIMCEKNVFDKTKDSKCLTVTFSFFLPSMTQKSWVSSIQYMMANPLKPSAAVNKLSFLFKPSRVSSVKPL